MVISHMVIERVRQKQISRGEQKRNKGDKKIRVRIQVDKEMIRDKEYRRYRS